MKTLKPSVDLGYPTEPHGKIPAFNSIEEEAEFWDTHDTQDFPNEFRRVEMTLRGELVERLTLRIDAADRTALNQHARKIGVSPSTLARMWIKERLQSAEESRKVS